MPTTTRASGPIVVIGSINMDLVCRSSAMPRPGETILGTDFVTLPGGKGANQAVAASKLSNGAAVHMIGRVGEDDFGTRLLAGLRSHFVQTKHVTITEGVASGVAMIIVDHKGENSIVVVPGANHHLKPRDLDSAEGLIASASAVVLQLEIPLPTVLHAIGMCQRLGVFTILDPAPVPPKRLARAFFGVDILSPNQTEAEMLLGLDSSRKGRKAPDGKQIAGDLLMRGAKSVVLKLGARGSLMMDEAGSVVVGKPFKVSVVDTTAAGDAFTGALAVARAEGMSAEQSLRFANAAGALCCGAFGAQPSLPSRSEVDRLCR